MTSSAKNLTEIELLRAQLAEQDRFIQSQSERIKILEEVVRHLKIKRFMPSSEKIGQGQFLLFDEAELVTDPDVIAHEQDDKPTTHTKKSAPRGRKPFAADLPREQIFLYLTDEEKTGAKSTFFAKVKEELDIVPAKVRVLEYMQEKAVFEQDEDSKNMVAAALPKHPIKGAMGSVGLIAHAITAKYVDGLPLYRIEKQLSRYGGNISRATLANYVIKSAHVLQPIINLMWDKQHEGNVIAMDETPLQVLKEPGKAATSKKYMWVSLGGLPGQQSVLYHYDPSRSGQVPLTLLDGFKGYLQTDGYSGYSPACEQYTLISVGCMDHARRKFKDALDAAPKKKTNKTNKVGKAGVALGLIKKLYNIERQIKDLSEKQADFTSEHIKAYRQQNSIPILEEIKAFLDTNVSKVPKDSLTGIAIHYMLNQWKKLTVYCICGELRISNILAENAIRPFVVGRKAWLFADTPQGAHASAVCYSIVESAKHNGLEPYQYIHDLLTRLPYAETVDEIETLLPWNINKSQ